MTSIWNTMTWLKLGEIDPLERTIDEFVEDRFTDMIERAQDMIDLDR